MDQNLRQGSSEIFIALIDPFVRPERSKYSGPESFCNLLSLRRNLQEGARYFQATKGPLGRECQGRLGYNRFQGFHYESQISRRLYS